MRQTALTSPVSLDNVFHLSVPQIPLLMGIFIPNSPGCDENEGEFVCSLPNIASRGIIEDEYKMLLGKAESGTPGLGTPWHYRGP